MTEREAAIARIESTRRVYVERGALWAEYIADCDRMLERLRAGLDLTPHQRGRQPGALD